MKQHETGLNELLRHPLAVGDDTGALDTLCLSVIERLSAARGEPDEFFRASGNARRRLVIVECTRPID